MSSVFHLFLLMSFVFRLTGGHNTAGTVAEPAIVAPLVHATIEDESSIPWSPNRKLTWDDFMSQPKYGSEAVALTSTALGLTYKAAPSGLQYQITCSFTKHKSWATMKTSYILAHEQAHFDITELFARRLHQALSAYEFQARSFKADIASIYKRVVKEKEEFQKEYDHETDHSRDRQQQKLWLERIDQMLAASESFAAYP